MMAEKETEGSLDLSKATRNRSCLSNRFLICFGRQHCKLILESPPRGSLDAVRVCNNPIVPSSCMSASRVKSESLLSTAAPVFLAADAQNDSASPQTTDTDLDHLELLR